MEYDKADQVVTEQLILEHNRKIRNFYLIRREYQNQDGFVRRAMKIRIRPLEIASSANAIRFAEMLELLAADIRLSCADKEVTVGGAIDD